MWSWRWRNIAEGTRKIFPQLSERYNILSKLQSNMSGKFFLSHSAYIYAVSCVSLFFLAHVRNWRRFLCLKGLGCMLKLFYRQPLLKSSLHMRGSVVKTVDKHKHGDRIIYQEWRYRRHHRQSILESVSSWSVRHLLSGWKLELSRTWTYSTRSFLLQFLTHEWVRYRPTQFANLVLCNAWSAIATRGIKRTSFVKVKKTRPREA